MHNYFLIKPEQIKLSLTNVCNYRCVMCYNPGLKQKRGFMKDDLFYKILDECQHNGIQRISLGSSGEALLHKNYLAYLRAAKKQNLWTSTTSNCTRLTPEMSDAIINENLLDRFNISVYSSTASEHKKYTGSDSFDLVYNNIKYFLECWGRSKRTIQLNMWFLQLPDINNYNEYKKLWGPIADQVGLELPLKKPINWSGLTSVPGKKRKKQKCFIEKSDGQYLLNLERKVRCQHIRSYFYILHDGTVVPCCNIPEPRNNKEIVFGDIHNDTLMAIWNSDRYRKFKRSLYNHDTSLYGPCRRCSELKEYSKIRLSLTDFPQRCIKYLKSIL